MNDSRRDFLRKTGFAALAASCGFPLLRGLAEATAEGAGRSHTAGALTKQWSMVIDLKKCLREEVQAACIEACHRLHNVPDIANPEEEVKWIWTEPYENAFPDRDHRYTADALRGNPVLVLCNHCTNPPCVKVCPTQATWKRKSDGIVMMDMHRCIGCRYCMVSCPYGARSFNWSDPRPHISRGIEPPYPTRCKGVVEKCTFCAERLREGQEPACVVAARAIPGAEGALVFGDVSDPHSEVSKLLRANPTIARRVGLGTGPNIFYII